MKNYHIIYTLLIITLSACTKDSDYYTEPTIPVVSAFIYAGNPITGIKVENMLSFYNDDDSTRMPISGLIMDFQINGNSVNIIENIDNPGYYDAVDSTILPTYGDDLFLQFEFEGQIVQAATSVPQQPVEVSPSVDTFYLYKIDDVTDMLNQRELAPIEFTWANENSEYYFFDVDNMSENPSTVNKMFTHKNSTTIISEPISSNSYNINPMEISHFGNHRVIYSRVNEEYAKMYETSDQDSRDLNEPYTNIENGMGIFTAFSSDTTYFYAKVKTGYIYEPF